ncbi:hypothetical protein LMH87_002243 [Akanthomyces muscarius]|uniref:Uncharacterized protein n=1 Tax=Akanthomyces muscarius TaxID=2231603 RepID=A0A9W8Q970_AKAMU|nr:hypothetical protein LMH87_002243 [Akanthomyces muscarius]KAJ4147736.1 hypothetical protein LMH87_002243 [Akanthomyces muscarius]
MSGGRDTHNRKHETERSDDGRDEISSYIELSRKNRELTAALKQLEKRAVLAEKETKELREAETETNEGKSELGERNSTEEGGKLQNGLKKNRKSKRKEAIKKEWEKVDARMLELDQEKQLLREEKQALQAEKQTYKNKLRRLLVQVYYTNAKIQKKDISSNMHGEAAAVGDAVPSHSDEIMDLATETKHGLYERSLDEEMQMAYDSETEDEEQYKGRSTSVLPPASLAETANPGPPVTGSPITGSPNLTHGVRQRERFRSFGAEGETATLTRTPEQIKMTPIGKVRDSEAICDATGRSDRPCFPALYPRLLAWIICIVLMAVGIGMTITACLYLQKAKKERNLWLEANGLTRAYLLAKAPSGDVD